MPFPDKCGVLFNGFDIDPFLHFNLAPVLFRALIYLKKILEISVFIISPQRKQPADRRSVGMNGTAAVLIQEAAAVFHIHMRKDQPVQNG